MAHHDVRQKKMTKRYPEYSRGSNGDIPEPLCYDYLDVFADHALGYLWDMNGVPVEVASVAGVSSHPLDQRFEEWTAIYDSKPLDAHDFPKWGSDEERSRFDADGESLARELFVTLERKHTVIYSPTAGPKLILEKQK